MGASAGDFLLFPIPLSYTHAHVPLHAFKSKAGNGRLAKQPPLHTPQSRIGF